MTGKLETLTATPVSPDASRQIETETCFENCTEDLSSLSAEILADQLVVIFEEFGSSIGLRLVEQQSFSDFEEGNQMRLESAAGALSDEEIITRFSFDIENLPVTVDPLFQPLIESGMTDYDLVDVRVYLITKPDIDFYGAFEKYGPESEDRGLSVFVDENNIVTEAYVDDAGIIILDGSALGQLGEETFMSVLTNEVSHHLLNAARNIYVDRLAQQYVGRSFEEMPSEEALEARMVTGFAHPDLPPGPYSYAYFNEFISDTASVMTNGPALNQLWLRIIDIGEQHTYGLSRDFYFFHLSQYLASTKGLTVSPEELESQLEKAKDYRETELSSEIPEDAAEARRLKIEILDQYFFDDETFFEYWREKIITVGTAFTQHVAQSINEL